MDLTSAQRLLTVALALGATLSACGDEPPPTEPEPVVARVEVIPGVDTLGALGQTRTFSAVAKDASGNPIAGKTFTWSSSASAVASVDPATGVVTAVTNGDATIRAAVDGVTGQAALAVVQQVATVIVTPGSAALTAVGATEQFGAEARDANNNLVAGVTFVWLSSNHNVATVTTTGLVTATGAGSATITAAGRGIPGSATVGVAQSATQLAFSIEPTNAVAGAAISPAVQVEIRDANGRLVGSARDPVTIALSPAGELAGTKTVNAIGGIATFSGLWIDKAGSNYALRASSGSLASATSASFAISPAAGSRFRFTDLPTLVELDRVIAPAVKVTILDAFDNVVPTGMVALAVGTNPGGAVLSGTLAAAAVNGVATFADLQLDRTGLGYTIVAEMGSVTGESEFFDVFAWTVVSSGGVHTCGVAAPAGAAYCWGDNSSNQLGDGTATRRTVPVIVSGRLRFVMVSAGGKHSCGLTTSGAAYCWGSNASGQLGNGTTIKSATPLAVLGGLTFVAVSAGGSHTCGLTAGGEAYCWGDNSSRQLGGTSTSSSIPLLVVDKVGRLPPFTAVSAGGSHTCGVTPGLGHFVYCWGDNSSGQLGNGTITSSDGPMLVGSGFVSVSAGGKHTCAVATDERTYCWGSTFTSIPELIRDKDKVFAILLTAVSAGGEHTCGTGRTDEAWCWGGNASGQLGNGTTGGSTSPLVVMGGLSFSALGAGADHTCGVTTRGAAFCWGANNSGQLGDDSGLNSNRPVRVAKP